MATDSWYLFISYCVSNVSSNVGCLATECAQRVSTVASSSWFGFGSERSVLSPYGILNLTPQRRKVLEFLVRINHLFEPSNLTELHKTPKSDGQIQIRVVVFSADIRNVHLWIETYLHVFTHGAKCKVSYRSSNKTQQLVVRS